MNIDSGFISLDSLIEIACADPEGNAIVGNSHEGRHYGRLAKTLCESIPDEKGFYVWGYYEKNGLWRNVYIGKSEKRKTASLRSRILEELKDERLFLWAGQDNGVLDEDLIDLAMSKYPHSGNAGLTHYTRSIRKKGTRNIIWVALPKLNNDDIVCIEPDIIETMNPHANVQRPMPRSALQVHTVEVIREFKKHIHNNR